jgi:V/A-type H+-transporting ATPase subunit I
MIVKMEKITLLLSAKQRKEALAKLRKLGVLHIHHIKKPQSEDIHSLETEAIRLQSALHIIGEEGGPYDEPGIGQVSSRVDQILHLAEERNHLITALEEQQETAKWFQIWGAISYSSLQELKEAGVFIRFYIVSKGALKKLPEDKLIQIVKEEKGSVYFALFARSPDERLEFREERIPEVEFTALESRIEEIRNEIQKIDNTLKDLSKYRKSFIAYENDLEKRIEFHHVMYGMGEEEHFVYLQGYCPRENVSRIKKAADDEEWAYVIQEPDKPDEVPTLIRNPKWLRIIDPLFKFMGTLPGYNEYDISLWFLLFFSLFFAILIGDGGYGLVFLGLTLFVSKKVKGLPKEPLHLVYVLGATTLLWGLITGTWFGYEKIAQFPFLDVMIIDQINSFADFNQDFMMYLCFVICIIHLSIAHAIKAFKVINSPVALAEAGWICILWALFFLAGNLVIGKIFPSFAWILLGVGVLLALLFSNFQKNILKGIGASLGNLPLSIISSFSDIVSYLRLFAVGYASVTVASSFNRMALDAGFHSVMSSFVAAFILFFGHTLNIMLGLMSVIVHGIRLNMLEFSGHLNMQWAGKNYRPFRE